MNTKVIKFKILKYFLQTKQFIDNLSIEKTITYLKLFAFSLLIVLILIIAWQVISGNGDKIIGLIGALAILISALLASYSVMLSIDTTVKIKNIDVSHQTRFVFFHLCQIKMRIITLNNEKAREKVSYIDIDRIFDTMHDINEMLSEIDTKDIVSIIHNSMLSDLHFLIAEIRTNSTAIKSIRANTIRVVPQKSSEANFNNPLITVNFRIEDSISKLTNILLYLREGYTKEFKQDGGIEACADYQYKSHLLKKDK